MNQTIVIGPALNLRIDPVKTARAGFSVTDVANLEASIVDGQLASNMIQGQREIGIRVRYPAEDRQNAGTLEHLLITSSTGITMPLSDIAHLEIQQDQTEIRRENLSNLTEVTARLEGRDLGSAMSEIKSRLAKEVNVPPGTNIDFGGLYQVQQESFAGLIRVFLASILLIFIVLTFEFRSFSHPTAILAATLLCSFRRSLGTVMYRDDTEYHIPYGPDYGNRNRSEEWNSTARLRAAFQRSKEWSLKMQFSKRANAGYGRLS